MAQNKKEIRDSWDGFRQAIASDDREKIGRYCTPEGTKALKKHFNLSTTTGELRMFFNDKEISGFESLGNGERVRVFIGPYNRVAGKVALIYIKEHGEWKIDGYFPGK